MAAFRVGKNPLANCAKNQYNRIVFLNISMNEVLLMPLWKRTLAALLLAVMMILPFASAEDAGEAVPDDSVEWTEGAANITRDLTLNDEGDDVSALQTALTDLCYYSGDVTGRYGEATRTAVEDFQRDFALAVTGMADKATQEAIYAAEYRPLRLGCVGEDVRQAQIRLMALGYYTGKISGRYLPATQEAIRLFQTANALPITGEADVQTLERLFSGDAISRDSSAAATPTPSPTPGMHLSDENTTPTPAPTVAFVKKLQYNKSKGEEVKLVQTRLTELGYYSGNISGNFLGHTRNAVKAFQQQNALSVDGIVGENTWNALFNDPDVRAATDDPKPTPEPTPVPFAITVDVNNQVTPVYGRRLHRCCAADALLHRHAQESVGYRHIHTQRAHGALVLLPGVGQPRAVLDAHQLVHCVSFRHLQHGQYDGFVGQVLQEPRQARVARVHSPDRCGCEVDLQQLRGRDGRHDSRRYAR